MKYLTLRQYVNGTSFRVYCEDEKKYIGGMYASKTEANTDAINHSSDNQHITRVRTIKFK